MEASPLSHSSSMRWWSATLKSQEEETGIPRWYSRGEVSCADGNNGDRGHSEDKYEDSSGQESRPLDLKSSVKPTDIFRGHGELKPMGESNGILDLCKEGRTLLTLVCQGRVMGEGTWIHWWLRTGGIGD